MTATREADAESTPLRRILKNTAWLLGGKGFGAVCGLAYLAILTRTLGLKDFGHFSLIFGTAQALIAIAGFQTWRVVVRYGSDHVHNRDWGRFGRLAMLCGMLDLVGAVIGCGIAAIVIYGFSHQLSLNPEYIDTAFWFSCASLWALVSAPTGIVRALDRFDRSVYVEAVVPVGRLLAALLIWATGPSVQRYLLAWAVIDLIEAALYWITARRLCPEAINLANLWRWREALRENDRVGHFFFVTFWGSTVDALTRNGPLLAVGAFVSTKAAGLYRLASQISQALSKLSSLLTRTVYSEVARVHAGADLRQFRRLALQTSLYAGLAGLVVVGVALTAGRSLLELIAGEAFEGGAAILVPLTLASSFDLASVVFEPVLHSTGNARLSLTARVIALGALGVGLYLFLPMGAVGAAWAVALGGFVSYLAMGVMAWNTLRGWHGARYRLRRTDTRPRGPLDSRPLRGIMPGMNAPVTDLVSPSLLADAQALAPDIVALRRAIHAEPELGLHTPRTRDKVREALADLPLEWVEGPSTTGLVATLKGRAGDGPCVLLRGDMDALAMPEETGLDFASTLPGKMHACGHDAHTAMLAGAARVLCGRADTLAGEVRFMFQPGEEGYHGARFMLEDGLLGGEGTDRALPDAAFAFHVMPNAPHGSISGRAGPLMAAADEIGIEVSGAGAMPPRPISRRTRCRSPARSSRRSRRWWRGAIRCSIRWW